MRFKKFITIITIIAVFLCVIPAIVQGEVDYFLLEDFENVNLATDGFTAANLSSYGYTVPEYTLMDSPWGKGVYSVMKKDNNGCEVLYCTNSTWVQEFKQNVANYDYFMFYVSGIETVDTSLTVSIRDASGTKSMFDASKMSLYDVGHNSVTVVAGNASGAGANTSVLLPAGFSGFVVYSTKDADYIGGSHIPYANINRIALDVRSSGAILGDTYGFDSFYLTNDPSSVLALYPAQAVTPTPTPAPTDASGLPELPSELTKLQQAKFMFDACKNYTPQVVYTPQYNPAGYPNIQALYFDSVNKSGRATKAYAYIGFPEGASSSTPVPAVVLVHGSGGHPFPQWIKLWTDRGYAAIAIEHGAYKPTTVNGDWVRDSEGGAPEDALSTSSSALDQQWMYHALVKSILANNILRADNRVDSTKIGVTGISAGGYILSNLVGYDNRFAFAIPVYGFGYMNETLSDRKLRYNAATLELWEGSARFNNATMPILIVNSNSDFTASVDTSSKSFDNLVNAELCIKHQMPHSHVDGWAPKEIYRFADSIVKNGQPLPKLLTQPTSQMGHNLELDINVPSDINKITVRVYYTTQPMSYSSANKLEQSWKTVTGSYADGKITATLPNDVHTYYISICSTSTNNQSYYTASRLVSEPIQGSEQTNTPQPTNTPAQTSVTVQTSAPVQTNDFSVIPALASVAIASVPFIVLNKRKHK